MALLLFFALTACGQLTGQVTVLQYKEASLYYPNTIQGPRDINSDNQIHYSGTALASCQEVIKWYKDNLSDPSWSLTVQKTLPGQDASCQALRWDGTADSSTSSSPLVFLLKTDRSVSGNTNYAATFAVGSHILGSNIFLPSFK